MKVLHMTLKKKWFDLIASGEKTLEYREMKPYWMSRCFTPEQVTDRHTHYHSRHYDEVHFKNGYNADAPFMRVEYLGSSACDSAFAPFEHGESFRGDVIIIKLGKVLEVINADRRIQQSS